MKLIVPFTDGFEEIEAFTIVDVLRRAGIEAVITGIPGNMITSAHGIRMIADERFVDINPEKFDGIVLPGGYPGYENLSKSNDLLKVIRDFNGKGKLVAAICGSPYVLAKAGILADKKATIYPGMEKFLDRPRPDKVVVDGNIITSQGPGTAIDFALAVVEYLLGKTKADKLRAELVVR